jgi:hypothetical protein
METRHDIARRYGYRLRSSLDADFLSRGSGDDLMKIYGNEGAIDIYAHCAEAYFVARLISNTPR